MNAPVKLDAYSTPDGGIRVIIPLPVSATGEPPTEMRLFHAGANDTTKGVYHFTAESAASIMAEFTARGVEKMADYNHASIPQVRDDGTERPPTAEEGRASCWYHLELRGPSDAPELWAVGIKWTPDALKYVTNRDYRYTSNAFLFDRKSNAVTRYLNFGLVNDPAAKNLPALVAASDGARLTDNPPETRTMKMSDKGRKAFLAAMDGDYESPAAMKKAMKMAFGEADMEPDEDDKPMKKMSGVLGCAADEVSVLTSIGTLRSGQAEILALTGKATLGEAVAVARAWQQGAESGKTAAADLAKLADAKRLGEFDAAIEKAKADMLLSPADMAADAKPAKYIATLRAMGQAGSDALAAYLGALSPKVATEGEKRPTTEPVTLSESDMMLCRQLGTDPDDFAYMRAHNGARRPSPAPEARK